MALPDVDQLVPELEVRLGVEPDSLQGNDLARAQAVLSDARALVTAAAGSALADPPQQVAVAVLLMAARRAYLNPSGAVSETVGPYSIRYGDDSPNGVYLTPREVESLRKLAKGRGIYTMRVERDDLDDTLWVGDQWAPLSDPIPWEQR